MSSSDSDVASSGNRSKMAQTDRASPLFHNMSHVSNQTTIPESYYLIGVENYETWAFRMKIVLLRDNLYDYCITASSSPILEQEHIGRRQAMSTINGSVKEGVAIKLLKRSKDPHEC